MRKMVIAIDGYSSTGKSSISKALAAKLGLTHVDTGALYRGVTLFALQNFLNAENNIDLPQLLNNLDGIKLTFKNENGILVLYLNDKNINEEIRKTQVSDFVSFIAKQGEIRDFLLEMQKEWGRKGGVIMDGRDIGTVVFPDADFKFFLTASLEERTRRRFLELTASGITTDPETVMENLQKRDKIDSTRKIAPLTKAKDAIVVDNTFLSKSLTVDELYNIVVNK